jgi:predicted metalloprotease with PDZ domain
LRLHIYKIRLREGHTYRCSAILEGISGRQDLTRIAPGGTLVSALQQEGPSLLELERSFRIRFLEPWTIHEPENFFKAGAGLWFKSSADQDKTRFFEITHILLNRSAERAGLKVGDRLRTIDGASADKLSFAEAVGRSYGPPGSLLQVEVLREGGQAEKIRLKRGVLYRKSLGLRYRWEGDWAVVAKVFSDSPASQAGLKEGDKLLQIGGRSLREMQEGQLRQLFAGDLSGDNALTYERPGTKPKSVELKQDWVPFPIPLRPESQASAETQTP